MACKRRSKEETRKVDALIERLREGFRSRAVARFVSRRRGKFEERAGVFRSLSELRCDGAEAGELR